MKLLIVLPTRSRLDRCVKVLKSYIALSAHKETRFVVSCDNDDLSMNQKTTINTINSLPNTTIIFNENKMVKNGKVSEFTTKICAINSGVKGQDFDVCLLASDDMYPELMGYDSIIIKDMINFFPDTDGVLWYNDGYQGDKLNTLCILGKSYYNRFGYIYHPSYITLYCDNEFTKVSQKLKKCKYINKTIIRHKHWSHKDNDNSRDSLDKKNDVFAGHDEYNFRMRVENDFK
jgi:uncharacterized protein YlzI (FlbEa/FlbD family)